MTSGRFASPLGPGVLLWALAVNIWGCSGTSAGCLQCPPVAGHYALALGDGTDSADCKSVAPKLPQGPLDVMQQGSALSAGLDGVTLSGTLYQTYDFTLLGITDTDGGSGTGDTQTLSGRYVPAATDGGMPTLVGDFQGDYSRTSTTGTVRCSVTRSFTATRQ